MVEALRSVHFHRKCPRRSIRDKQITVQTVTFQIYIKNNNSYKYSNYRKTSSKAQMAEVIAGGPYADESRERPLKVVPYLWHS
jgi:hypothetical protein